MRPVRQEVLLASTGATDFSGLFIGFSLFLIAAAALLVVLLCKFGLEQRAREAGLLLATGYPLAAVGRRFLGEGIALAALGALLGLAGAPALRLSNAGRLAHLVVGGHWHALPPPPR